MGRRTWWKFSHDMCERPEVVELSKRINLPDFAAAAVVALFYIWAIDAADESGSVNDYTTKAIENACRWTGKRGELLAAFHASGIVVGDIVDREDDDPLRVANWEDVAGDILEARQRTRERVRKFRNKAAEDCETEDADDSVTDGVTRYITEDATDGVTEPIEYKSNRGIEYKSNRGGRGREDTEPEWIQDGTTTAIEAYASSNLNYMSPRNMEELAGYMESLPGELIRYAIDDACANGKRSWAYVRSILQRYQSAGYKTVGDIQAAEAQRSRAYQGGQALNYAQRQYTEDDFEGTYIDLEKEYGKRRMDEQ